MQSGIEQLRNLTKDFVSKGGEYGKALISWDIYLMLNQLTQDMEKSLLRLYENHGAAINFSKKVCLILLAMSNNLDIKINDKTGNIAQVMNKKKILTENMIQNNMQTVK